MLTPTSNLCVDSPFVPILDLGAVNHASHLHDLFPAHLFSQQMYPSICNLFQTLFFWAPHSWSTWPPRRTRSCSGSWCATSWTSWSYTSTPATRCRWRVGLSETRSSEGAFRFCADFFCSGCDAEVFEGIARSLSSNLSGGGTFCTGWCAGSIVRDLQAGTCGYDTSSWWIVIIEHQECSERPEHYTAAIYCLQKNVKMLESPFDSPLNGSIDQ